jgi:Ran GTPase-activating protein (RanGAP) involved in mRNA processing and transport
MRVEGGNPIHPCAQDPTASNYHPAFTASCLWTSPPPSKLPSGKAIAATLQVNAVLTDLSVAGNNIGPEGAKAFADALRVNAVLTDLNLRFNHLGPEGGKALAEALRVNAALKTCDVSCNSMGEEAEAVLRERSEGKRGI